MLYSRIYLQLILRSPITLNKSQLNYSICPALSPFCRPYSPLCGVSLCIDSPHWNVGHSSSKSFLTLARVVGIFRLTATSTIWAKKQKKKNRVKQDSSVKRTRLHCLVGNLQMSCVTPYDACDLPESGTDRVPEYQSRVIGF